jgi:hypothetical protein
MAVTKKIPHPSIGQGIKGLIYSVSVGKLMGSTQIPPTFLALRLVVISVLLFAV